MTFVLHFFIFFGYSIIVLASIFQGCSKTFPSVFDVKKHLETCEKAVSYKCLACSKTFAAQLVARNHVKFWHVGFTVNIMSSL